MYSKRDLLNEIIYYIEVLKYEIKIESDKQIKQVLNNVVYSLDEIISKFKK